MYEYGHSLFGLEIFCHFISGITVALISYSLSKAAENSGLIAADKPPAGSTLARVGYGQTDDHFHLEQQLSMVVGLRGYSPYVLGQLSWHPVM